MNIVNRIFCNIWPLFGKPSAAAALFLFHCVPVLPCPLVSLKNHAFDSWFGPKCCFVSCSVGILLEKKRKKRNLVVCTCVFYLHRNFWCCHSSVLLYFVFLFTEKQTVFNELSIESWLPWRQRNRKEFRMTRSWTRRLLHHLVPVSS